MSPPQRYVYVLSECDGETYAGLTYLSALSLRHCEPAAEINIVTDCDTRSFLESKKHPLNGVAHHWHEFEVDGDSAERSRNLKTTLRSRLRGYFVYLDADTVVVDSPAELFTFPERFALVQDQYEGHAYPGFPDWLVPHFERLGWSWPTAKYYNSGVMVVPDDPSIHRLFEEWHVRWRESRRNGLWYDQPALNYAIECVGISVRELTQKFNAMVRVDERYRREAVILHLFYGEADDPNSEYTRLLRDVLERQNLSGKQVVDRMSIRGALCNPDSIRRQLRAMNFAGAARIWARRNIRSLKPPQRKPPDSAVNAHDK